MTAPAAPAAHDVRTTARATGRTAAQALAPADRSRLVAAVAPVLKDTRTALGGDA